MTTPMTYQCKIKFEGQGRGARKTVRKDDRGASPPKPTGRVPRISKLMALAIRFEELIQRGEVADYAELARLAHVSRARITQIMNLRLLAPDIQEAILFLPCVERGRDEIHLRDLQPITLVPSWRGQRRMWKSFAASHA
jgi:hypothetical protein